MDYFFKKEAIMVALYIVLIVILRHGTEKKKITYWKIVESFIIVVGLEAMTGYYGVYMSEESILPYSIAQWLLLSIVYILAGLTIYHACTQSEMSYITMCKRFPLWVQICIPACIVLGVVMTILDYNYSIELLEQLNRGNISLLDALTVNFVSTYQKIREMLRFLNIGILVYGCSTLYKNYDKQGE